MTFTITIRFNQYLIDCSYMFYCLDNILIVDTTNFYSFNVKNMRYMFYNCFSLISLDLSNFDTSSVTNMAA